VYTFSNIKEKVNNMSIKINGKWVTKSSIEKMSLLDLAKLQKNVGTKGITSIKRDLAKIIIESLIKKGLL